MDTNLKDKPAETVGDLVDALPAPRSARVPALATNPNANLLQLAIEQGRDLPTLERLMDLSERWEANNARKAFVAAMAAFKADPPTMIKNKKANFGQGKAAYTFAGLDQIAAVIGAALAKHGLSAQWRTDQAEGRVRVTCTLRHELGHSEETSLEAPADSSGSKNPIQAVGSTITYLSKYTLLSITGLAASDQDDDGAAAGNGETITAEQRAKLIELFHEASALVDADKLQARFFKRFKIDRLDDLPQSMFDDAKAALVETINANSKNKVA